MQYREREVSFYSEGNRIAAVLYEPAEQTRPGPGIVTCQGLNGIGRNYRFPQTCRAFATAGYTSLIFDFRGFGDSEGTPNRLWPQEQLEDTRNALSFLETLPGVDSDRLGLWGTSYGGAHVVHAAGVDPRVKCVVSVVGIGNSERWLRGLRRYWEWRELLRRLDEDRRRRVVEGESEVVGLAEVMPSDPLTEKLKERPAELSPDAKQPGRTARMTLESVEKLIAYRPEDVVDRISPRPLLLIHTEDDVIVPVDESRKLFERAGEPKQLVVLPGHHYSVYLPPLYDEVTRLSLEWLQQHLPV
ncbi:MAG: alpha/beta fold hydrolase [Chloroflexi bacterium]|nr:alpha/beta fold hydrolase [Chloroflexota bacterium]